ncbi:MAG: helix-turn-helix transcriptional regulator [Kiritimatiellae bacterium]|nr:helix-turn-helix transcriptional regulator [Kiritimatiellia bacterium]
MRRLLQIDFELSRCCFDGMFEFYIHFPKDSRYFLSAARYAVIGATGLGDTGLFNCILNDVMEYPDRVGHPQAEIGVKVFNVWLRQWLRVTEEDACTSLRSIDPGEIPPSWRPMISYSLMHSMLTRGECLATYAMAVSILLDWNGIFGEAEDAPWVKVACALCCRDMGNEEDEKLWFSRAIEDAVGMCHALPFMGIAMGPGSVLEKLLQEKAPKIFEIVHSKGTAFHRNRVKLHNAFTGGKVSELLSPREFYMVKMVVKKLGYKEIAARMGVSLGRAKNIALRIYGKLNVHSKKELAAYIW